MNHYIHAGGGGEEFPPEEFKKFGPKNARKHKKKTPLDFFTAPTIPLKEFEKTVLLCSESRLRKIWIKK